MAELQEADAWGTDIQILKVNDREMEKHRLAKLMSDTRGGLRI